MYHSIPSDKKIKHWTELCNRSKKLQIAAPALFRMNVEGGSSNLEGSEFSKHVHIIHIDMMAVSVCV